VCARPACRATGRGLDGAADSIWGLRLPQGALAKAEAAAQAAANGSGLVAGTEALAPRVAAARRQLEVQRAAEALAKAAQSSKTVTDLPRLEAAILAARKVGVQDADPETCRWVL
jgi:hypothetical protein